MSDSETSAAIQEIVDRETRAWKDQDAETLVSIFHPDMVWPWPPDEHTHDPVHWTLTQIRCGPHDVTTCNSSALTTGQ